MSGLIKKLLDQALWKYSSVLIAQPFEVAKTILQCYDATAADGTKRTIRRRNDIHGYGEEIHDDDDDDDDVCHCLENIAPATLYSLQSASFR